MIKIKFKNTEITVRGKVGWAISSISEYMKRVYGLDITNEDLLFLNAIIQDVDDG